MTEGTDAVDARDMTEGTGRHTGEGVGRQFQRGDQDRHDRNHECRHERPHGNGAGAGTSHVCVGLRAGAVDGRDV